MVPWWVMVPSGLPLHDVFGLYTVQIYRWVYWHTKKSSQKSHPSIYKLQYWKPWHCNLRWCNWCRFSWCKMRKINILKGIFCQNIPIFLRTMVKIWKVSSCFSFTTFYLPSFKKTILTRFVLKTSWDAGQWHKIRKLKNKSLDGTL